MLKNDPWEGDMEKKILVVDDEPEIVQFVGLRLAKNGYKVLKASNGIEAIKIAKKELPDLVVMDILMPEMDGSKTASLLKECPETKDIPVIFLTCLFTKEDEMKGSLRGDVYFVSKPYDGDQLMKVIKDSLRSS
jgi:two-component system alkaline phosphatase synthesis response regulator PhoP